MTVGITINRNQYQGNDSTTEFAYQFEILEADDLIVILTDTNVDPQTSTVLTLNTDYTVSGVGETTGGNVTYPMSGDELATGELLTILRKTDLDQLTDFDNQGGYFADSIEDAVDKLTLIVQDHEEALNRAVLADKDYTGTTTPGDDLKEELGGVSSVISFNGRTGIVVPESGDYTAGQVSGAFDVSNNDSDDIIEGSTNLFLTDSERTAISNNTTNINTNTGNITLNTTAIGNLDTDKADKSNVLELDNATVFTPDADYEPATKKYVDDSVSASGVTSVNGETGVVTLTTGDITEDTDKNYVTDSEKTVIGNTSGINTGDQDLSSYVTLTGTESLTNKTINGVELTTSEVATKFLDGEGNYTTPSGEANTTSNSGTGEGLALPKNGIDLPFKSLKASGSTSITSDSDSVTISSSGEANNISDTDATDLTDGGDTTLHYHSTDRDRTNHTGTQTASTISDFDTEVSNNSAVQANTAKVSYNSTDSTKVGYISVTQAVDLDTMESDIATNNAKVSNSTHTGDVTGSTALTLATKHKQIQRDLMIPDTFMDSRSVGDDLLLTVMKYKGIWDLSEAKLTSFKAFVVTDDSGATQPQINFEIAGTEALSSDLTLAETDVTGTIDTANNTISTGDRYEVTVVNTGTNSDAENCNIRMIWEIQ